MRNRLCSIAYLPTGSRERTEHPSYALQEKHDVHLYIYLKATDSCRRYHAHVAVRLRYGVTEYSGTEKDSYALSDVVCSQEQ